MNKKTNKCTSYEPYSRLAIDHLTDEEYKQVKEAIKASRLTRPAFYKQAILAAAESF